MRSGRFCRASKPSPYGVKVPYPTSTLMRSPTRNLEFLFWPVFFFFNGIFVWFGYQVVASQNELSSVPSSAIFWKSFRWIGVTSSLNDRIYLWSYPVLDFCFLCILKSQFQSQFIVCVSGSVLGDCTFLRICPFF